MAAWQPSAKTRLTLKQLGFPAAQTRQVLVQYRLEHEHYDDLSFMQYLKASPTVSPQQHRQVADTAQVPIAWRPAQSTVRQLCKYGFSEEVITHYSALFVVQAREERQLMRNSDAAFTRFCQRRPRSLPEPLPQEWMPDPATVQSLRESVCADMDYLTQQIGQFIRHHQFSVASDWNARFEQWVKNGNSASGIR